MSNFLPKNELDADLLDRKLELGEQISDYIRELNQLKGFEDKNIDFIFDSPKSLSRLWLPIELDSYTLTNDTGVKRVGLKQLYEASDPQPITVLTLFFKNGERVIIYRDPSDYRSTEFISIASYQNDTEEQISRSEVGYMISSLVMREHKVDYTELARQSREESSSKIDPTNASVAKMIQQSAFDAADSYTEEENTFVEFEDDRYGMHFKQRSESSGLHELVATYTQEGSDNDENVQLEIEAKSQLFPGEISDQAGIIRETRFDGVLDSQESGDNEQYLYDFMSAAIKSVRLSQSMPNAIEEQL